MSYILAYLIIGGFIAAIHQVVIHLYTIYQPSVINFLVQIFTWPLTIVFWFNLMRKDS